MTLELATSTSNGVATRWATILAPAMELATTIADSDFVPTALRGNPGAICACILYGDELGIGPIQALQSIPVIEGKPTPSAALVRALVLREGHSFVIHEATGTRCLVSGLRKGLPESQRVRVEWNLDMARSAGLLNKAVWQRYPRAMLMARASSELGNQVFPDVLKGLGPIADDATTAEQVQGWVEDVDQPKPPPRKRIARKRAPSELPPPEPHALEPRDTVDTPLPEELTAPFAVTQPPVAPGATTPQTGATGPSTGPRDISGDLDALPPNRVGEPAPWPPLPPEPKEAPDSQMGEGLRKAYMVAFQDAGIDPTSQRELRLAVTSSIVGRHISSSKVMARREGLKVVGALAEVATGAVRIVPDADGAPRLVPTQEPPREEER